MTEAKRAQGLADSKANSCAGQVTASCDLSGTFIPMVSQTSSISSPSNLTGIPALIQQHTGSVDMPQQIQARIRCYASAVREAAIAASVIHRNVVSE